jgi:hypothetical protein
VTNWAIDDEGVFEVTHSSRGDVARDLRLRGERVLAVSKRLVNVKTGRLKADLHTNLKYGAGGNLVVEVGSDVRHALLHHGGTRPHIIRPRNGGVLRFPSGGKIHHATLVRHPGTRPNPYLTAALPAARG